MRLRHPANETAVCQAPGQRDGRCCAPLSLLAANDQISGRIRPGCAQIAICISSGPLYRHSVPTAAAVSPNFGRNGSAAARLAKQRRDPVQRARLTLALLGDEEIDSIKAGMTSVEGKRLVKALQTSVQTLEAE